VADENRYAAAEIPAESGPADSPFWTTASYTGLVLFLIGYYNRPEDAIGPYFRLALVGGILAIGAYITSLLSGAPINRIRETVVVVLLFAWLALSIPFSNWMGGSFQTFKDGIGKVLVLTIVIMNVVSTTRRLRALLLIQVLSITVIAWMAHQGADTLGRAAGDNNTAFGNSNDLAVLLCINLPLVFLFILESRSYLKAALYLAVMSIMLYTVFLTYSRTGILAMVVAVGSLVRHFGLKQKQLVRVAAAAFCLLVVSIVFIPKDYGTLIASIFSSDVDVSESVRGDASESRDARQLLLGRAVALTLEHPIFGVGLNGFEELSESGHVQHNSFLQYSSEAGIPALLLFLTLIGFTFANLRGAELLSIKGSDVWLLAGALRASLWAFLVGALFLNFAYLFFPYFIFAFAAALHQIALNQQSQSPV
jgi:O-antigen ligase